MTVYLLAGLPASGKTTFAYALAEYLSEIEVIDVGESLRAALPAETLSRSEIGPAFVRQFGVEGIPGVVADAVRASRKAHVVVDALRHPYSIRRTRDALNDALGIFVACEENARLIRLRQRLSIGNPDPIAINTHLRRYSEYDQEAAAALAECDLSVENSGPLDELALAARRLAEST